MRILQVVHNFLPTHIGGSELSCFQLSSELAKRHDVRVMFTERDHLNTQYHVARRRVHGLDCFEVCHNHVYDSFQATYQDQRMDAVFLDILNEVQPDVVHIHHLLFHSVNYITIAKKRGIPVVMTLHDYWLSCPNMGQRLRLGPALCDEIPLQHCARCVVRYSTLPRVATRLERSVARYWAIAKLSGSRAVGSVRRGMRRDESQSRPNGDIAPVPRGGTGSPFDIERWLSRKAKALYGNIEGILHLTGSAKRASDVERRLARIRAICNDVDLFVAPSRFMATQMLKFGLPVDRLVTLAHGVAYQGLRDSVARPETDVRFGYIGSLAPHKGVHILIGAFRKLVEAQGGSRASLHIWGDQHWNPGYVADLRRLATDLQVQFRGRFEHSHAAEIYARLDVVVVPSIWWENASLTILEASATHTPIIATAIGGTPELVADGRNGLLVRPGDVEDLTAKMLQLVDSRVRLGLERSPRAEKTMSQYAGEIESHYLRLVEPGAPSLAARSQVEQSAVGGDRP